MAALRPRWSTPIQFWVSTPSRTACISLIVDHGNEMVENGQLDAVLKAAELPAEYLNDPRVQRVLGHALQVGDRGSRRGSTSSAPAAAGPSWSPRWR